MCFEFVPTDSCQLPHKLISVDMAKRERKIEERETYQWQWTMI